MSHFMNATFKWAFIKDKNNLPAYKEGTEFRLYLQNWERLKDNEWIYHTQYTSRYTLAFILCNLKDKNNPNGEKKTHFCFFASFSKKISFYF